MFVREVDLCQLVQTEKEKKNRIHYAIKDRCYRRHIYMFYMSLLLPGLFFVVVHDLDLDLHEKINRNKRTRMVIIFFSHLLFFFSGKLNMYIFVLALTNPRTN